MPGRSIPCHWLFRRAAGRAGDAGDGNRVFPAAVFERALGHGAGDGLADEAVLESMVSEESFFRVRDSRGLFKG